MVDSESDFNSRIINKSQCFACKLFSAPLFYIVGSYLAHKNYNIYKIERYSLSRLDKFGFVFVPSVLFVGGTINLYQAWGILHKYKEEKEIMGLLMELGMPDDLTAD